MNRKDNELFAENQTPVSVKERLARYLYYWPLFLACIAICVTAGFLYIRYTAPKYMAVTRFLIKGAEVGGKNDDLIASAMNGKQVVNLNNEMLLITASSLMERAVVKNNFNLIYYKKGRLLDIDIYKDAPFDLLIKNPDSSRSYSLYVADLTNAGGNYFYGVEKKTGSPAAFSWLKPFVIDGQTFVLIPKQNIGKASDDYIVRWQPVKATAAELSAAFSVKAFDIKTSVIELTLKTQNIQRGKDVLNALFNEFNLSDIEERHRLSDNTVSFIDERMVGISNELQGVEGNLENYQGKRQLVDIKGQSSQSLINSSDVGKTIKEINIQQGVAGMITDYFQNPANSSKLVPSSLGLNDATLSSLITQYNELQLKKERELPNSAPNGLIIQDLNTQINSLKSSITESLNSINANLKLQENSFRAQSSQYNNFLSSVPHSERVLQEIKRKQNITEGLYLYLLQKREEAAISRTASDLPNYKQIDPATGYGPVEPNTKNIYMYSFVLGFFIAFAFVYVRLLINDKVNTKEDLKKCPVAHIGEVATIPPKKKQLISVLEKNTVAEQFRAIRTRINPILKEGDKKIILVTSSSNNEGKSFISLNMAAVYATPGKKIALLDFDMRQPSVSNDLHLSNAPGLTNYLSGEITQLSAIAHASAEVPGLDIYPAGPIPDHPADLLLTRQMSQLFEALKKTYDYIIIDSSPAGMVTDPFIIGSYCDLVVYVIRFGKTQKKQLDFINETAANQSLKNIYLLLNDVKTKYEVSYGHNYEPGSNGSVKKRTSAVQFEKSV